MVKGPSCLIPVAPIRNVTLELTVKELIAQTDLRGEFGTLIPINDFPEPLRDARSDDLLLLQGDVCAFTTVPYLRKVDSDLTLAGLFQERGLYIPFRRNYLVRST